jgi:hypothetical protein
MGMSESWIKERDRGRGKRKHIYDFMDISNRGYRSRALRGRGFLGFSAAEAFWPSRLSFREKQASEGAFDGSFGSCAVVLLQSKLYPRFLEPLLGCSYSLVVFSNNGIIPSLWN